MPHSLLCQLVSLLKKNDRVPEPRGHLSSVTPCVPEFVSGRGTSLKLWDVALEHWGSYFRPFPYYKVYLTDGLAPWSLVGLVTAVLCAMARVLSPHHLLGRATGCSCWELMWRVLWVTLSLLVTVHPVAYLWWCLLSRACLWTLGRPGEYRFSPPVTAENSAWLGTLGISKVHIARCWVKFGEQPPPRTSSYL